MSSPDVASTPPRLTATVSDPHGDSLNVTFYGRAVGTPGPDFTLVEIPDTQYYSASMNGGTPAIFRAQTEWIASSRVMRNIAYVMHVGDIVQNSDNGGNPVEWIAADFCMKALEDPATTLLPDGIPYGISPGNHDIAGTGADVSYNYYFGSSRFAGRSYYGGHYGTENSNWFDFFSASGLDFIVIGFKLMWTQDPAVVHWADSLLTAYPNRRAIVVSHYLLDPGPPASFSPQGQAIYDGLKSHANLFLMICGHYVNEARRADTYNGHTIYTVMTNFQNWSNGGNGWLRYMEFSPTHNQIRMRTFSPTVGQFLVGADSSSQFTVPCDLGGGDVAFHPIGTLRKVPSGSTVSMPWTGLRRGKRYEWYATATDGAGTVAGPASQFQIADNDPPAVRLVWPNGGEALEAGTWVTLQWNASDEGSGVSTVDLSVSRNGSAGPWLSVASDLPNTGSYRWHVDGPTSANATFAIVARDSFDNIAVDASDGPVQITATTAVPDVGAGTLALDPVAPDPARGASHLGVTLAEAGRIRLEILDVSGREVAVLADRFEPAGRQVFTWDGRVGDGPAPDGVYLVQLRASGRVLTRRFVLSR